MRERFKRLFGAILVTAASIFALSGIKTYAEESGENYTPGTPENGWYSDGKGTYWYENGNRQGSLNDPKGVWGDGSNRGREIYDPNSDGWYWLDSVYDGAKAIGKEVWMPYIYQDEDKWDDATKEAVAYESDEGMGAFVLEAMKNKSGKWVRYDANGRMLKGWVIIEEELAKIYPGQAGNIYYYDTRTGLMAKGVVTIDGSEYEFDDVTGELLGITNYEAKKEVCDIVNEERKKAGVAPLTLDTTLCERADIRAKEIASYMSHTRPDGSRCFSVIADLSYRSAGENIAGGQISPEDVMRAWMNSSGHRANILSSKYKKIGVGLYFDANSWGWHWVQLFIS